MNPDYDLYDPLPEPWMDKVLPLLEEHVILDAQMVKGILVEVLHNPLIVVEEISVSAEVACDWIPIEPAGGEPTLCRLCSCEIVYSDGNNLCDDCQSSFFEEDHREPGYDPQAYK